MTFLSNIGVIVLWILSPATGISQIQNSKTEKVTVYGNCTMCKSTIEKAGNLKKVATVDWDKATKMATITYNEAKTSTDEILKRIALAGYDSDTYLAPDDVYAMLPECCQYKRVNKNGLTLSSNSNAPIANDNISQGTYSGELATVFEGYFALKDALVQSDGPVASAKAKQLYTAINGVKMQALKADEHTVWMTVMKELANDAEHISETKDIARQRDHFITLSENIYKLAKVSKAKTSLYYQHCPMANDGKGANWLSRENTIKNPYYGTKMLSCGKTIEEIK